MCVLFPYTYSVSFQFHQTGEREQQKEGKKTVSAQSTVPFGWNDFRNGFFAVYQLDVMEKIKTHHNKT
jgi:hypothetical protein